jgi:pimeloyl-ACP methyl ester carboxylesterase
MSTPQSAMLVDLSKHEKYVDLTAGRMRYVEMGSGDDHLLLVHGMGVVTSLETYQWVIEPFANAGMHVYALDMFGFGKSREVKNAVTFDVIVDSIREFMDRKGIDRACYIGHSAGGWWGGILAYESPDRLRKFVMVTSAGLDKTPVANVQNYTPPTLESTRRQVFEGYKSVYAGSNVTPEAGEALAQQMLEFGSMPGAYDGLKSLVAQMADPVTREQYLLHRRVAHIKVPTMVVWSKLDTKEPFPTWTAEWERIGGDPSKASKPWVIPGARYVLLEDRAYNPQWEAPEEFTNLAMEFFRS